MNPQAETPNNVFSIGDRRLKKAIGIEGENVEFMNLSKDDLAHFHRGIRDGTSLEQVAKYAREHRQGGEMIGEEILDSLVDNESKVNQIMKSFGIMAPTVNFVARAADGKGFTRMMFRRRPNGTYEHVSKGKEDLKDTKASTKLLEDDVPLFELGVHAAAA